MKMKYKFDTLEEVKIAIEQWFKDCGYYGPDTDGKQKAKIFEEITELEAEIKSGDIDKQKNEAGDVFVTLVGKEFKDGSSLKIELVGSFTKNINDILYILKYGIRTNDLQTSLEYLNSLCKELKINLLECATIAYNKIQGRLERGELSIVNGTVVKSGK